MRALFVSLAPLLMLLAAGCTTVDPDECWVNTSGGFGDDEPIPIGAGVGATSSGDFITPPQPGPLAAEGKENPCVGMVSITYASYSPSEFPFVTTVPDDGTDKAGGWQEAKANLEFIKKRRGGGSTWICSLTVGMPLRGEKMGKISASLAAEMSADIAEEAAYEMDFNLPVDTFCRRFRTGMLAAFKAKYPNLGSRVTQ